MGSCPGPRAALLLALCVCTVAAYRCISSASPGEGSKESKSSNVTFMTVSHTAVVLIKMEKGLFNLTLLFNTFLSLLCKSSTAKLYKFSQYKVLLT